MRIQHVDVTLVIPTYNEYGNVAPLLEEIGRALIGVSWEALFVDDSTDGTNELIAELAKLDGRIRLLHRPVNRGGLSGAVVDGLASVRGDYICVIDADLQHPPASIPVMLMAARRTASDVVVASRYLPGGSAGGLAGPMRRFVSQTCRYLARAAFPVRLRGVSDPLGGFFLVRREVTEGVDLRPLGYKILLEILVRCEWHRAVEVPYRFRTRRYESSKADLRQGLDFLRHVSILFRECSPALFWVRPVPVSPARGPEEQSGSPALRRVDIDETLLESA